MKMKKRMMRGGGSARKNGAKMMKRGGSARKNAPKMMKRGGIAEANDALIEGLKRKPSKKLKLASVTKREMPTKPKGGRNAPKMMKRGGKVKKMASGGGVSKPTMSNADIARELGSRTISDRDLERIMEALMPESGRTISDEDRKRLK